MTSWIRSRSTNDDPRQWNLGKRDQSQVWLNNNPVLYGNDLGIVKLPIKKQLSCNDNIISIKVTTGNAPNKLEATNNIVEHAYAISEENSEEQGTIDKFNVLPSKSNLAPIMTIICS